MPPAVAEYFSRVTTYVVERTVFVVETDVHVSLGRIPGIVPLNPGTPTTMSVVATNAPPRSFSIALQGEK